MKSYLGGSGSLTFLTVFRASLTEKMTCDQRPLGGKVMSESCRHLREHYKEKGECKDCYMGVGIGHIKEKRRLSDWHEMNREGSGRRE